MIYMSKLIIALYVLATSAALIFIKLGSSNGSPVSLENSRVAFNLNPTIIFGGLLYVISFALYTYLISKNDLGYIIPLTTALVYVLIFIASFVIFGEVFTFTKVAAIMLIFGGVLLLNVK